MGDMASGGQPQSIGADDAEMTQRSSPVPQPPADIRAQELQHDAPGHATTEVQARPSHESYRRRAESLGHLQTRGTEDDVQSALRKIERIQRQKESKRRWRRGTGLSALPSASSHDGKPTRASLDLKGKERYQEYTVNGTPRSEKDAKASMESSTDKLGEVKLAVGSMPSLTAMMSRARKSRNSNSFYRAASTTADLDNDDQNAPSTSIYGMLSSAGASAPRQHGARRDSVTLYTDQKSSEKSGQSSPRSVAYTEKPSRLAGGSALSPASTGLGRVREEEPSEEAEAPHKGALMSNVHKSISDPEVEKPEAIVRPVPQRARPRLMIQSPTEIEGAMMQSPVSYAPQPNVLSGTAEGESDNLWQANLLPAGDLQSYANGSGEASPSPSRTPGSDSDVNAVIDVCQESMSRSPAMGDAQFLESVYASSSGSSSNSGSESDLSDLSSDEEQQISSLNLEHGNELTPKQKKRLLRRMKREKRHFLRRGSKNADGQANGLPDMIDATTSRRAHKRAGSLSMRVASGLQYASTQSRNRRAMEKYSPHPSRPSSTRPDNPLGIGKIKTPSRTSSPLSALPESNMQSLTSAQLLAETLGSGHGSFKDAGASGGRNDIANDASSVKAMDDSAQEEDAYTDDHHIGKRKLQRWGTSASSLSAQGASAQTRKLRARLLSLRRGRRGTIEVPEEEDSDHNSENQEDEAEKALDHALGKLAAEQYPEDGQVKYEYDVLHENQRGMLFFGIPKFSAKTLFQWDPSPWADARFKNSVYNIANAQLPDPSWEWVHPEWMIDMSGDVDEAGWQYSFNFGRFSLPLFVRPQQTIPRANAKGNEITNERFRKAVSRTQAIEEKQASRCDDGVEALMRSAVARQAKWTGIPTQNTYVRRRRWIRLRARKPLPQAAVQSTPRTRSPEVEKERAFSDMRMERSPLPASGHVDDTEKDKKAQTPTAASIKSTNDVGYDDMSTSDFEDGSTSSSSTSAAELGSDGAQLSGFFPRKTAGHLSNGRDPLALSGAKAERRRRRHAREFTGTIRELKTLLPTLLDRRSGRSHRTKSLAGSQSHNSDLWQADIDARNPFLCWSLIKRRLDDDDLAFATSSLRARERRYAQAILAKTSRTRRFSQMTATEPTSRKGIFEQRDSLLPAWDDFVLTKDALVEINFRRVLRVLRATKLDRHKIQLWRLWLGVDNMTEDTEPMRHDDLIDLGLAASAAANSTLVRDREEMARLAARRWKQQFYPADPMDVWDVLERRLDRILMTFEYQSSRATVLRLLLTVHASTHALHNFRPGAVRLGAEGQVLGFPEDISPLAQDAAQGVESKSTTTFASGEEWRAANLPRLEFWSDLMATAKALLDNAGVPSSPPSSRAVSASPETRSSSRNASAERSSSRASQRLQTLSSSQQRNHTTVMPISDGSQGGGLQSLSRSSTPKLPGSSFSSSSAHPPRRLSTSTSASATNAAFAKQTPIVDRDNTRRLSVTHGMSPAIRRRMEGANPTEQSTSASTNYDALLGSSPSSLPAHMQGELSRRPPSPSKSSPRRSSDADRAFLSDLLQLPEARQKDLLLQMSSAVVLPSTLAARSRERSNEHKSDLSIRGRPADTSPSYVARYFTDPVEGLSAPKARLPYDEMRTSSDNSRAIQRSDKVGHRSHGDLSLVERLTQAAEAEP